MSTGKTRRHHPVLRGLVAAVICLATLFAASLPLYVFPPQSAPKPADVVFVIGPPRWWRIVWARRLIAAGDARALMISVPDPASEPACHAQQSYPVFCQRVTPFTTQGEARWLQGAMARHGWNRAIVITTTPHVVRTRLVMDRCVPSGVQVVGRPTDLTLGDWAYQYAYQTGAFFKAFFVTDTC
ncbi:MAG: YdcF family protein [Pseudoclavibacter sp.]